MKLVRGLIWAGTIMLVLVGILFWVFPASTFPASYKPHWMGIAALVFAIILWSPRLIFKAQDNPVKKKAVLYLQFLILVCCFISSAGNLGLYQLYEHGFQYDKLVHFLNPLIFTVGIAYFRNTWYNVSLARSITGAVIVFGVASIGWEVFEIITQQAFNIQLVALYNQSPTADTFYDIIADFSGIILGAYLSYDNLRDRK